MVAYSPKVESNLHKSKERVFSNGCNLLEDANALFEAGRLTRAGSLAILSLEEFSKALILHSAILQKRWDEEILKLIRSHEKKHAIVMGALEHLNYILRVIDESKRSLIPVGYDHKRAFELMQKDVIKKYTKKRTMENARLNIQYVDIHTDGSSRSDPSEYDPEEIAQLMDTAQRSKIAVNAAIFEQDADNSPLLRTGSSLVWEAGGKQTIHHKDGFDIICDPWNMIARKGSCTIPSKDDIEDFAKLIFSYSKRMGTENEQHSKRIANAARIIRDYQVIEQLETQMVELDIKSSKLIEICKQIVDHAPQEAVS